MTAVVEATTDFAAAVAFFKMGFPLKLCMRGVPWPQNRYELPSALFIPQPTLETGCGICNKIWSCCRHALFSRDGNDSTHTLGSAGGTTAMALDAEGIRDEDGTLWPYFTQSMEEGYNDETYLIRHWSDEYDEWSLATALNGETVAGQLVSLRTGNIKFWRAADPTCFCHLVNPAPTHDAWDKCDLELPAISDEEFPE